MSTSAATVAIAAGAMSTVERARQESACREVTHGYEHNTATVGEARQYADCIDLLHPDPMTEGEVFVIKVFIVCAIIGGILNMIFYRKEVYGFFDWFMFCFFGALAGMVPPGVFYLIAFLLKG